MANSDGDILLPERCIPIPRSISDEARAVLTMPPMPAVEYPPLDDRGGWDSMIADYDKMVEALVSERAASLPVAVEEIEIEGVHVFDVVPSDLNKADNRLYL